MDSKKLFPDNKPSKRKVLEFIDKKGFYVVLILCILIVGVAALYLTTRNASPSNSQYDNQKIIPEGTGDTAGLVNGINKTAQSAVNTDKDTNDKKTDDKSTNDKSTPKASNDQNTAKGNNDQNTAANTDNSGATKGGSNVTDKSAALNTGDSSQTSTKPSAPKKKEAFLMPVFGQVSFEYAQDKLVYSKTLEEWRTHSGVDIAADRGTPVKAVADGVVTDIKNDPRFGITIVIDHKDGTKTVYANLASDDTVSPNQKVKQGDVIGAVGNSASFESAEQPHLHFEVLKDDEPTNPLAYLPKMNN